MKRSITLTCWLFAMGCGEEDPDQTESTTTTEAVEAGPSRSTFPCVDVVLAGEGSGTWSVDSGPDGAQSVFADPSDPTTTFRGDRQGTYVLQRSGDGGTDTVEVSVELVVDTLDDLDSAAPGEPLSLRAAVGFAQACPGEHHVVVDVSGELAPSRTIVVDDPLDAQDNDLVITGQGAASVTGGGQIRLFSVADTHLTVETLSLRDGLASDQESGGAVQLLEGADLTLRAMEVVGHETTSSLYGGAAVHGRYEHRVELSSVVGEDAVSVTGGGWLDVMGEVEVSSSSFARNVTGGDGGALSVQGDLALEDVVFDRNTANRGGAVHVYDGDLTLQTGSFSGNQGLARGGAVFVEHLGYGATHTVDLTAGAFTGNTSLGSGGALALDDGVDTSVAESSFAENAAGTDGGAVAAMDSVVVTDSQFVDQAAGGSGGAIYLTGLTNEHVLEISGTDFEGNVAGTDGGAVFELFSASVSLTDSRFVENASARSGGALLSEPSGGGVVVEGCTFERNQADRGAGIYTVGESLVLGNTMMTGQVAGAEGGAVYALIADVQVPPGSAIFGNTAGGPGDAGAGVCNEGGLVQGKDQVYDNIGGNFCVPEDAF